MPRKRIGKKEKRQDKKTLQRGTFIKKEGLLSQWKWGESYTSLLLGIVVVIVAVLFGVTLVKQHKNIQDTSSIQITPSIAASPTTQPTEMKNGEKVYTVVSGDNLWSIAEKFYQSGYNWVDIAKANNLSDPQTINQGNELVIPSVTPDQQTVTTSAPQIVQPNSITGNTYTVQKGDDLWSIAVRAYGDGYKWVDIAKANNLENPDLVFSGNSLTIPR